MHEFCCRIRGENVVHCGCFYFGLINKKNEQDRKMLDLLVAEDQQQQQQQHQAPAAAA